MKLFAMPVWILLALISSGSAGSGGFLAEQKKFERVRSALNDKEALLTTRLKLTGSSPGNLNLLLIAYKESQELEVWAKPHTSESYSLLSSYKICASSGKPGPKRRMGDNQVPEGFYQIDRFNPSSNYHLSLGLNYPNKADRIACGKNNPGGDIFIHGSCVTIGCLPMTDDKIREIYLLAVYARDCGQNKIPVYIFPFRMNAANMAIYEKRYAENPELLRFWNTLKSGYLAFQKTKREVPFSVDKNGNYTF